MAETMKAVVKTERAFGGTEIKEVPIPTPGQNDVLIKVKVASICGTDVHIYNWDDWAANRIKPPLIYGHEFAGEVVKIGKNVTTVKVGDYVSGECHIADWTCFNCRTGLAHICENTKIFGVDVPGIFAEYACIPATNAWKNDPDLKLEHASIQDPLGNAVHTVFATDVPGRNVAIMGCGPIGMLTAAICKHIGAAQIFAVGRKNEYRVDLAKKMGADYGILTSKQDVVEFIKNKTDGRGCDVVLEMSGSSKAVENSIKCLRQGGTLALLGVFADAVPINWSEPVFKYITIKGINGRLIWDTWYRMAGLLKGGLNIDPVITHKFKFEEFEKGMQTMRSGNSGKVVLKLE